MVIDLPRAQKRHAKSGYLLASPATKGSPGTISTTILANAENRERSKHSNFCWETISNITMHSRDYSQVPGVVGQWF